MHAPLPSNIPVLNNQMDPVFNDTATYNIPSNQTFSPYSDSNRNFPDSSTEEHDAVQSFFRGAEAESSRSQKMTQPEDAIPPNPTIPQPLESASSSILANQTKQTSATADSATAESLYAQVPQAGTAVASTTNEQENIQQGNNDTFLSSFADQSLSHDPATLQETTTAEGGVDYQSLLDTIAQSASTAPPGNALIALTTAASDPAQLANSLPSIPGLPPKPPAQSTTPRLTSDESTQVLYPFTASDTATQPPAQINTTVPDAIMKQTEPSLHGVHANGFGSAISVYQTPTEMSYPAPIDTTVANTHQNSAVSSATGERPWTPTTQRVYDQFLEDERRYVTEGIWDRFPNGSRLFVGNLPSEKVTKRDLFHIFHSHGRLAQISIKQAYGFVQFLEASSCFAALQAEQANEIRGRKIHLEISKPQKNTRGSGAQGGSGANKSNNRRRSRSPERSRSSTDRFGPRPPFSEYRDEAGRQRNDVRQGRSPSPRRYRSRDDFRPNALSPQGYQFQDPRPRSPAAAAFPPPFPPQGYDEDAALQLPRRDPRDVPDVQILILDPSVAQSFINWVEQTFRSKGLRASTIWLSQRLPLQAVVKRQIMEGVQAIVKLIQHNQFTTKVPLQVFDRSAGASNVNFNEYVDLDVPVAADIVLHARNKERTPTYQPPQPHYPPRPAFSPAGSYGPPMPQQSPQQYSLSGTPHFHQQRPPQPPSHFQYPNPQHTPQHPTPATPNASNPNLQQLLANLGRPQNPPPHVATPQSAQGPRQADLGGLLSNIAAHQQNQGQPYNPPQPYSQQVPQPAQPYGAQPPQQAYGNGQQSNVQNIMDQLARYQR
jgi:RNA recognition motif. (a.k.a. RRM, RBD, or RNP domain)